MRPTYGFSGKYSHSEVFGTSKKNVSVLKRIKSLAVETTYCQKREAFGKILISFVLCPWCIDCKVKFCTGTGD